MSANVRIFVPVPEKCIGLVIGQRGCNIKRIEQETQTRIKNCCEKGELGRTSGFSITGGTQTDRERAEQAIKHCVVSTISFEIKKSFVNFRLVNHRIICRACNVIIIFIIKCFRAVHLPK